jgi:ABC-type branched-subunit amino acid transport system substrate-binding protein
VGHLLPSPRQLATRIFRLKSRRFHWLFVAPQYPRISRGVGLAAESALHLRLFLSSRKPSNHATQRVSRNPNAHFSAAPRHANGNSPTVFLGQKNAALCAVLLIEMIRIREWSLWFGADKFCRPMRLYMHVA